MAPDEVWTRWVEGLRPAGVGVAVLGLALTLALRGRPASAWRLAAAGVGALAAGLAVSRSLAQAWLADDAFISFRYARNLAEGAGLVWNPGERVEGYTNFLWTVALGAGERVGLAAPYLSTALTLMAVVALALVGTVSLSRPGWVSLAPALLVLSLPFVEFGTSGLESGPAAVCIALSALWLRTGRRPLAAWWVLVAALLRPDHVLFFAPLALVQVRAGRRALWHTASAGLAWATWWCARWAWYGAFFPNTFYAKSGGGAYWSQGGVYWGDFALSTQLWLAVPVGLAVALGLLWRGQRPGAFGVYTFVGATLYGAYIARVGGDFMEYRFGLTSFALLALGLDAIAARAAQGGARAAVLASLALLPLGASSALVHDGEKLWQLSRESSFYRVTAWAPLRVASGSFDEGQALARLPERGAHAPPLAVGAIGMVGYLSRVPIVDMLGLTNARVAHQVVVERGRPGHEKHATVEDLLASGAQWSVGPGWPALADATRFTVEGLTVYLLRDTPAVRALGAVPPPERVLAAPTTPEDARALEGAMQAIYSTQASTLRQFRERWALTDDWRPPSSGVDPAVLASFLRRTGAPTLAHVPLDEGGELEVAGVTREGAAFSITPGAVGPQKPIVGMVGRGLVNGYAAGDGAVGRLTLRLSVGKARPVLVSLLLGGGAQCERLYVEVAGARACARSDEVLRTVAFLVDAPGDEVVVSVVDEATDGWGHLLVDDVRAWSVAQGAR